MKKILVKFKNDNELIGYTTDVLDLLKTEPAVEYILLESTGEILYTTKK